jgi:hypothetical protein
MTRPRPSPYRHSHPRTMLISQQKDLGLNDKQVQRWQAETLTQE